MMVNRLFPMAISLFRARFLGLRKPLFISWRITNRCNLKCKYCDYWKYTAEKELNTQDILNIINRLSKAGTLAISFTGGEPLLREDIGRIIGYAASKGITCKINTNGLLIAKKIDQLVKVAQVNLSFDGPEDIHDQIRGVGSYRVLFDAVSLLNKNKKKIVFHIVLSKYNVSAIDFILNKCREVNVGAFFQPATELYLLKKDVNPHSLKKDNFNKAVSLIIKRKKGGDKYILNSVPGLKHLAFWPYPRSIFCAAGKVIFRINPRGDFYNCERFPNITSANCLENGVGNALRAIPSRGCSECWCGPLVELNLLMQGKISAIINSLSYI